MARTHFLLWAFLIALLAPQDLVAEWRVATRGDQPSAPGGMGAFAVNLVDGSNGARLMGVWFSAHQYEFRLVPNLDGFYSSVRQVVEQRKAVAGINGGYFKQISLPVGLLVSGGKTIHPLERAKLLSGVLAVRNGFPALRRTSEFASTRGVGEAIQCGPFLVELGRPVSGLNNNREAARSFVFATDSAEWGIGICRSVTLRQLAEILVLPGLLPHARITRALNLDGGSSTAFYFKTGQTELSSPGWVAVSNYVTVTSK
jgi:exopolysaccharide biosynthesis protein